MRLKHRNKITLNGSVLEIVLAIHVVYNSTHVCLVAGSLCMLLRIQKTSCCLGNTYSVAHGRVHAFCSDFNSPAYATPKLLDKKKLTLKDVDVFEYHEAFAVSL